MIRSPDFTISLLLFLGFLLVLAGLLAATVTFSPLGWPDIDRGRILIVVGVAELIITLLAMPYIGRR